MNVARLSRTSFTILPPFIARLCAPRRDEATTVSRKLVVASTEILGTSVVLAESKYANVGFSSYIAKSLLTSNLLVMGLSGIQWLLKPSSEDHLS